jgi:HEPN domain-containing protein
MKSGADHSRILLEKAANDLRLVEIGLNHGAPADTLAFHLQQFAEKSLKAVLAFRGIVYPKTHDLDQLFDLLPADISMLLSFRETLVQWTAYAVDMRYEIGEYPSHQELRDAARAAGDFRAAVTRFLPPGSEPDAGH